MGGSCYLDSADKADCFGCEACVQACAAGAIEMVADEDGFRYPGVDVAKCLKCGHCRQVCPVWEMPGASAPRYTFGGYVRDSKTRDSSTSGGAFSAIAQSWADDDTLIFGAESVGLNVRHCSIRGVADLQRLRKSKYLQSAIGRSFEEARDALRAGKRVLFSGTPCQVAGLKRFLREKDDSNLLTVEVVCEGVPTPNYISKFAAWLGKKKHADVQGIDYRFKDGKKWDFQVMQASLQNSTRGIFKWKQDRWFNPFWSIWLQHLMSRPSCYRCPFARRERVADISLGDLWGVHLYCPDLYGRNGGASVIFCNTEKGVAALNKAKGLLFGRELNTEDAIRYQGPLRGHIKDNPDRNECLRDIRELPYEQIVQKWAKPPTLSLLFRKYIWGNRQKIAWWRICHKKAFGND